MYFVHGPKNGRNMLMKAFRKLSLISAYIIGLMQAEVMPIRWQKIYLSSSVRTAAHACLLTCTARIR